MNLPFRVDTPPTLTGNLTPCTGRKGDLITINAQTDLDVEKVSISVLNESFNLTKQAGGKWTRNYVIPRVLDGSYPVTLTASDRSGYITTIQLLLTVDSAEPTIVGNLTPTLVRSGSTVNLTAQTDPETVKVTAQLLGDNIPLTKQADGTWKSTYNIPPTTDGKHTVYFIAEDTGGNQGTDCQTFTVDNTPPTISGSLTPNGLYAGENIDVDAYTSNDAKTVTASFGSEQKTLHDTSTAAWSASYTTTTTTTTGEYQMNLQTSDALGNTATMTLPYTIYPTGEPNTPTQPTTPETTGNPTPGTSQENSPSSSSQIQPSSTSQSFGSAKKSDSSTSSNKSENGSESKDEGSKNERSQSNLDFIKFLLEMILFILAAAEMIFAIYIIYYLILALILAGGGPFAFFAIALFIIALGIVLYFDKDTIIDFFKKYG